MWMWILYDFGFTYILVNCEKIKCNKQWCSKIANNIESTLCEKIEAIEYHKNITYI